MSFGVEGQLAHLSRRGLGDLLAVRVADLNREEAGESVQVAVARVVFEVAAAPAHDDRRLVAAHLREVEPEVVARERAQVCRHQASFAITCLICV